MKVWGGAFIPRFYMVRRGKIGDGKMALMVECGCQPEGGVAFAAWLGDKRCVRCGLCGAIIGRWGHRITAMGWDDSGPTPIQRDVAELDNH